MAVLGLADPAIVAGLVPAMVVGGHCRRCLGWWACTWQNRPPLAARRRAWVDREQQAIDQLISTWAAQLPPEAERGIYMATSWTSGVGIGRRPSICYCFFFVLLCARR